MLRQFMLRQFMLRQFMLRQFMLRQFMLRQSKPSGCVLTPFKIVRLWAGGR